MLLVLNGGCASLLFCCSLVRWSCVSLTYANCGYDLLIISTGVLGYP